MNWHRVGAIVLKSLYSLRRDIFRLFDIFYWPAFSLFTWGLFSVFIDKTSNSGMNIVSLLLGAIILWTFFERASKDISLAFIDELWNKNFINIFSTPLTITEYLVGISIVAIVKLLVSVIFMFILAKALYGFQILTLGIYLVPAAIGLTIFGWTLSLFVQSCILRFGHTVEVFIWAIATLVQPFSCVFYPMSTLPEWAQKIAVFLPPTYLFENMRRSMAELTINTNEVLISYGLNILYFILAARFFKRSFSLSKKSGSLIKNY
jgi:ABC-2 type transport system permease protein